MGKRHKKNSRRNKVGLSPGTLVHVGEAKVAQAKLSLFDYKDSYFIEKDSVTVEEAAPLLETETTTWLNVAGLHEITLIESLGKLCRIHPLSLEDILNTQSRAKLEEFDDYIFIVVRMLEFDETTRELSSEQLSLIFRKNLVVSFQENEGDVLNPLRNRLRLAKGNVRRLGADYLTYAIIDGIVDHYFVALEQIGEVIEDLEDRLLVSATSQAPNELHGIKRELILLRKAVWPLREVLLSLLRTESPLVSESTKIFVRDLYDHTIQVIDTLESMRDLTGGLLEIFLASASNKMNEIMKVLTVISTIFMPLTFIVGIYGMNFEHMPELHWIYGYPFAMALMITIALTMVVWFRRRKWI